MGHEIKSKLGMGTVLKRLSISLELIIIIIINNSYKALFFNQS